MTVTTLDVTPDLARTMLQTAGIRLRRERGATTNHLINLATTDSLIPRHAVLRFVGNTANGTAELVDGQSVLNAIIATDRPLICTIIDQLPEEVRYHTNFGTPEGFADWLLKERKQPYGPHQASITTLLWLEDQNLTKSRATGGGRLRLNNQTLGAFYDANPAIAEVTPWAVNWSARFANYAAVGVANIRITQTDAAEAEQFFTLWDNYRRTGAGLLAGHPLIALTEYFAFQANTKPRIRRERTLASIYRSWNAMRQGRSLPIKQRGRGWGAAWLFSEDFPVPI